MGKSPTKVVAKRTAIDRIARLTAGIQATDRNDLDRLRRLMVATAATSPERLPKIASRNLPDSAVEEELHAELAGVSPSAKELREAPLHLARRDPHETLLELRLADSLTALGGVERMGPFIIDDRPIFFEFWREAKRFEIIESGKPAPAFVLSSARRPRLSRRGSLTLYIQKGTVWIRGDLLNAGLPAGAYVGVTVSDGSLHLPHVVTSGDQSVEITSPAEAKLELVLAADQIAAAPGGCDSGVALKLPKLTLSFGAGGLSIQGEAGKARFKGQDFAFAAPTGSVQFVPQLWTLLLGYSVEPDRFDAGRITSSLADFSGEARVNGAALSLPVVVAAPAALGPAAVSPGFWVSLSGVGACWYAPDNRPHLLDPWLMLSNRGAGLLDLKVEPLTTSVKTGYRLWELDGTEGKRLAWHQDYEAPFLFLWACDLEAGETLTASGNVRVALDRPVLANGSPLQTPTNLGALQLRARPGGVDIILATVVTPGKDVQLVLRNALVWATQAGVMIAQGPLTDRQHLESGALLHRFGVYGWSPTLPDPYVGNFHICRPSFDKPRAALGAHIVWTQPDRPELRFVGDLGLPIVCENERSPGESRPAPRSKGNPSVGLTQTEQGRLYPDRARQGAIAKARAMEQEQRAVRIDAADRHNKMSQGMIEGQLRERLGPTPPVFLLDVSTNQDLLGVALWGFSERQTAGGIAAGAVALPGAGSFPVRALDVMSPAEALRLVALPQVQWEPVRTLDEDQDLITLGWFPTPLASASDGGATVIGARSQKLAPVIPEPLLDLTKAVFDDGTQVTMRTTLPFGLVSIASINPNEIPGRKPDSYEITRPTFPLEAAKGGIQITAKAGADTSGRSPCFAGVTRQLINGVDLASGAALGLSVLGSTGDPNSNVEAIFNRDMTNNPKVPVTRLDISGYGGSNFSTWENPFALFAETAKTQFQVMTGRTALEIIKVASVLHPWGIKVTRSVIVERRSGGGVIRRDSGWQATSPGLFDYRYNKPHIPPAPPPPTNPQVADYRFDAGIFRGLFDVRSIRPAPGTPFSNDGATFVPYYFDAALALDGLSGRTPAHGILGWLQIEPNGAPASAAALRALIKDQGAVGGPIDTWIDFGSSKLPFRAQRIEVDVTDDADNPGKPLFVATTRGVPRLPTTGSWSVVQRPVANVAPGTGEAVPISETKGAPIVRRYAVKYPVDASIHTTPPHDTSVPIGDWRMADPADLLTPATPQNEYCIVQSAPTHAFLFPRPYAANSGAARLFSAEAPALAHIIARATSKGAFPPRENAITLSGPMHFNVAPDGGLALSNVVNIVNHPVPLRLAGTPGHGTELSHENSTLEFELTTNKWRAEFTGLTLWSDIAGLARASGAKMRILGSTDQRPQVAEIETLVYEPIEKILTYLPIFGARGSLGPIDLGASNAKHEVKIQIATIAEVPKEGFSIGGGEIKLTLGAAGSTGFDLASGGVKAGGELSAGLKGEFPILSVGVASVYIIVQLDVKFSIASVVGVVTEEKLELIAFVGVGVKGKIAGFKAYAYLGIGFVFVYDFVSDTPKFGGLVRFEAGVDIFSIVKVKIGAELKGLIYKKTEALPAPASGTRDVTYCDYSGKVKLQVDIFLIISISATYSISDTKALE
jgi:hypothetical protein